LTPSSIG